MAVVSTSEADETGPTEAEGTLDPLEVLEGETDLGPPAPQRRYWSPWRVLFLVGSAFTLYLLLPRVLDVLDAWTELRTISWPWFIVMLVFELGSFVCMWWLIRVALPQTDWFTASTSQMAGAAVTKAVPGGAAIGAALQFRMLAASGVRMGTAGSTMAATSIVSTATLFAMPAVALLLAFFGAPIPRGLSLVAWAGGILFILLVSFGVVAVNTDRPLVAVGSLVERAADWIAHRRHRVNRFTVARMLAERDRVKTALGERWGQALVASAGNWLLDYLALVAALQAVGTSPRMSLVLLAYGTAAVLSMIPITPGGLGFVEAGLVGTLTIAGVPASDAVLATLAYRMVSYWLPLPAGLGAYIAFRFRYGDLGAEAPVQVPPMPRSGH
jgi:uncharacterized protein (TIRG00374 family)